MKLSRRELILKYVVEHFIATAEPVGSQTLIDKYKMDVSSATVRAELNVLEKEGYLEKTHTSSGRIPSSKGYRYYVDHLRGHGVDSQVKWQLRGLFQDNTASIEEVINSATEILTHMTNLASIVLGPSAEEERLISVQMIPISETVATSIFVTDQGYVENKTFIMPEGTNIEEVQKVVKLLNDRLKGTPISQIEEKLENMRPIFSDYIYEHTVVFQALSEAFTRFIEDRLALYGRNSLYGSQPETRDAETLTRVLNLLEDRELMKELLTKSNQEVQVFIGSGSSGEDGSVVTTKVRIPGRKDGTIAIIGPTRMDYSHVMSTLEYVVDELENYFRRLANIN